jgi:3',5'-cyclic AMP phosphodiesterase CpdA
MSVPSASASPTRLLHLSDLHIGTIEAPPVERALEALVERLEPQLVIASGDLTHRGRRDQHERAATFLRSLGPPVLAIPGNHDIPYSFPARFTRTFKEFERHWETTEPVFQADGLIVVGLNSVRPWLHQRGGMGQAQLERAGRILSEAPEGALRVVTLHHHLIGAPWRTRKRPVSRRSHVLASLVDYGAELIIAGHIHQAAVAERHEFEVTEGELRGATVSIAPGLGQPRPRRRGEARGLHVYECTEDTIRVETYVWREEDWGLTAVRVFARGREPLRVEPATERAPARGSP